MERLGEVTDHCMTFTDYLHNVDSTDVTYPLYKYLAHPSVLSTFQHTTFGTVFTIHPNNYGTAIINCFRHKELNHVDKAGKVSKKEHIGFTTLGFISLTTGGKLLTNIHGKCIMRLTDSGDSHVAFSTSPLIPIQICETEDGSLLVTLSDNAEYDINDENTRVLTKYTNKGLRMLTVERDNQGQRLFCRPGRLKCNKRNGQIMVGNRTGETAAHIVVFDTDLRLLFRYLGNGRALSSDDDFNENLINTDFFAVDADFDIFNNIVVVDNHTKSVELLDCYGQLLQIVTQDSDAPRSLCVNFDQTLWIGFTNGKVKVIKYIEACDVQYSRQQEKSDSYSGH
ncbi:uncharacterized protein LOC117315002 [Pecten maximus]|uniref:uncharacterized protein LOC117315002 n=1 Tax=Pecten maximus TaxID=6579 RepID=UPI001458F4AE|nr:uncharacterized protein LOC117315002 [Pecten maximus]